MHGEEWEARYYYDDEHIRVLLRLNTRARLQGTSAFQQRRSQKKKKQQIGVNDNIVERQI